MTKYRTADGVVFTDENNAVIHAKVLDYLRQGLEVIGKPYEYSMVERIEVEA